MTPNKKALISELYLKFGFEDITLNSLIELIFEEEEKLNSYKDFVCDTVNSYHNDKKELLTTIGELITVLEALREYTNSEQRQQILWDTGTEALLKAQKVLNKL